MKENNENEKIEKFNYLNFSLLVVLPAIIAIILYLLYPSLDSGPSVLWIVPALLSFVFLVASLYVLFTMYKGFRDAVINLLRYSAFILGMFLILIITGIGFYYLSPTSYPNWPVEKKQAYQFMLLKRKLLSNPEKLQNVSVVVQEKDWQSDFDTLSPVEIKKLMSYPSLFGVEIIIPFKEFGEGWSLSLKRYENNVLTTVNGPLRVTNTVNEWWGTATWTETIGRHSYPYAQGKHDDYFTFKEISDVEFEKLTLEALKKANNVVKKI